MRFFDMKDCCWKQFYGSWHGQDFTEAQFISALKQCFTRNGPYAGAVMLCVATGGDYVGTVPASTIKSRAEQCLAYIEDNDLGEIIEIPKFKNELHRSTIRPYMWIINRDGMEEFFRTKIPNNWRL